MSQPGDSKIQRSVSEAFDAEALAIVLSRYDLGSIDRLCLLERGSRDAPKLVIECQRGVRLLKRRTESADRLARTITAHTLRARLHDAGVPIPRTIASREGETLLRHHAQLYELFEFVSLEPFARRPRQAHEAGRTLAVFHAVAESIDASGTRTPAYHAIPKTSERLRALPERLGEPELGSTCESLADAYDAARQAARDAGVERWPAVTIHGDWHPGNLAFDRDRVGAIYDLDTIRTGPRALDIASGAFQFSSDRIPNNASDWAVGVDETLFRAFCDGYDAGARSPISRAEVAALPALMIESLVAEALGPIATTGRFGVISARDFLPAVARRVGWIERSADSLRAILG
ncbi:MAG: phosphotransferase [Planctomycetota bacterium]